MFSGVGAYLRALGWFSRGDSRRTREQESEARLDELAEQIHRNLAAMEQEMARIRREEAAEVEPLGDAAESVSHLDERDR